MIDASRAADLLLAARKGGGLIAAVPSELSPGSVAEAYAVQDAIIARSGAVGGWKVAAGTGPEPWCSPLPAGVFFTSPAEMSAGLTMIAEVEVAVKLGRDLPASSSVADVEAAIASLRPAIELIGSPFVDRSQIDKITLLGDLQSNAAVITGEALTDWRGLDLTKLPLSISYDGVEAGSADTGPPMSDVLEAIAWLAGHAASRGASLKAGQVIITGSRVNRPFSGSGKRVDAVVSGLGSVSVVLT